MAVLRVEQAFLAWYRGEEPALHIAARVLEEYLKSIMASSGVFLHVVESRAKSLDSVRTKLLAKRYKDPRNELTDLIGARIIVFDARDIDRAVTAVKAALKIRKADSSDKRTFLGPREFGYRSYHLVAALCDRDKRRMEYRALDGVWFEVQVRSILEHVWAEIEHEVVYKARAKFPADVLRKFASLAAVLELLDQDFGDLIQCDLGLIPSARDALKAGRALRIELDVPHLLAALELAFPHGMTFGAARGLDNRFPPRLEARVLLALKRCGISSVQALRNALRSPDVLRVLRRYAREENVSKSHLSHFAATSIVIAVRNHQLWTTYFPEFADSLAVQMALGRI